MRTKNKATAYAILAAALYAGNTPLSKLLLFAIPWGGFPAFLISTVAAIVFDGQFILIRRYNRPRVVKILELRERTRQRLCGA
ncbi:MAG: hypothetical protein IJP03_01595 [Christensenellaceae bacterium]|nr:hypothetical protein [Christensenellaceae bacterium]